MKYLVQGHESKQRIELLLELTNIRSEALKQSLMLYLVDSVIAQKSYIRAGVNQQNFARGLKRLEFVASRVEKIKELDWQNKK